MEQRKKKIVITGDEPEKSVSSPPKPKPRRSIAVVDSHAAPPVSKPVSKKIAITTEVLQEAASAEPAMAKKQAAKPKTIAVPPRKTTVPKNPPGNTDKRSPHVNDVKHSTKRVATRPSLPLATGQALPVHDSHPAHGPTTQKASPTKPANAARLATDTTSKEPKTKRPQKKKVRYWAPLSVSLAIVFGIAGGFAAKYTWVAQPVQSVPVNNTKPPELLIAPPTTSEQRNLQRVNNVNTLAQAVRGYSASKGNVPTFAQLNDPSWRAWNLYLFDGHLLCVGNASAPCSLTHDASYDAIAYKTFGLDKTTCEADCPAFSLSVLQEPDQKPYIAE